MPLEELRLEARRHRHGEEAQAHVDRLRLPDRGGRRTRGGRQVPDSQQGDAQGHQHQRPGHVRDHPPLDADLQQLHGQSPSSAGSTGSPARCRVRRDRDRSVGIRGGDHRSHLAVDGHLRALVSRTGAGRRPGVAAAPGTTGRLELGHHRLRDRRRGDAPGHRLVLARELEVLLDDRHRGGRRGRAAAATVLVEHHHRDLRRLHRREAGEPGVVALPVLHLLGLQPHRTDPRHLRGARSCPATRIVLQPPAVRGAARLVDHRVQPVHHHLEVLGVTATVRRSLGSKRSMTLPVGALHRGPPAAAARPSRRWQSPRRPRPSAGRSR